MQEIPYIDIHSHINFEVFKNDSEDVIKRALSENVYTIVVGTQYQSSKKALEIANKHEKGIYACIGVHPIHSDASFHDKQELGEEGAEFTSRGEIFKKENYESLLNKKKTVAIGECGLDYYHLDPKSIKKQTDNFISQIEFANENKLPLMLHVRNSNDTTQRSAYLDVADILKSYAKTRFNFHFFAGTVDDAKVLLDMGAFLSFTGVVTFAKQYEELVAFVPNDRIMSETDCPYVAPVPYRGKRNEPVFVIEVVKKMAQIKGVSIDTMKSHIWNNATNLFGVEI